MTTPIALDDPAGPYFDTQTTAPAGCCKNVQVWYARRRRHGGDLLTLLIVLLLPLTLGCTASPLAPGETFFVDPSLQTAMDFIDADRWINPLIGESTGQWIRAHTNEIVIDANLPAHVSGRADRRHRRIQWAPLERQPSVALLWLASGLIHEARHLEGYAHTCGTDDHGGENDATFEEAGAYAVQILFLEHHLGHDWGVRAAKIGCR